MSNMPNIRKRFVGVGVEVETCVKVEKKFGQPNDKSMAVAYVRALEEATRDVLLTPEDHRKIADEIERNAQKRLSKKGGHK